MNIISIIFFPFFFNHNMYYIHRNAFMEEKINVGKKLRCFWSLYWMNTRAVPYVLFFIFLFYASAVIWCWMQKNKSCMWVIGAKAFISEIIVNHHFALSSFVGWQKRQKTKRKQLQTNEENVSIFKKRECQ